MPFIPVAVVQGGGGNGTEYVDFGPPPVAGYVGWYDASDTDTVVRASADSNLITSWDDKSANAFDLAVQSGRPTLLATVGAKTVVFIDGLIGTVPTQLSTASISMSDRTATAFVVASVTSLDRNQALLGPSNDGGNALIVNVTTGQLATTRVDVGTIGTQGNAAVTPGVPFVAGQLLSDTDVIHYLNLTSEQDLNADAFTAARTLRVGTTPSAVSPFASMSGWIGEMVFYNTTLSTPDAESVIAYLMNKWAIA